MNESKLKPVIYGALAGTLIGILVGLLIARRRSAGGRANVDARAVTGLGVTAVTLLKQIVDLFSS